MVAVEPDGDLAERWASSLAATSELFREAGIEFDLVKRRYSDAGIEGETP